MTLSHLAGIFTSKPLAETTRERLRPAGVTVHRMDLAKVPPVPISSDDGQPVISFRACRVRVVRTRYSASDSS